MKKVKEVYCNCGEKLSDYKIIFSDLDGSSIIPLMFAKNIDEVKKFYKEYTGDDYEEVTGENPDKCFTKGMYKLTHCNPDVEGYEEMKKHSFGEVECWCDL